MAEENLTPEQLLEQQKKNCIFCRIISGEIESKKVFESDRFLAVLDIKPAASGHVILMPKDHYPILPLLPEELMLECFSLAAKLAGAVREAMIAPSVTVFTASGYAAGQQAPHLLVHIIPREKGDGLQTLDMDGSGTQADVLAAATLFSEATRRALSHRGRDDLLREHHIHKRAEATPKAETTATVAPQEPSPAQQPRPAAAPEQRSPLSANRMRSSDVAVDDALASSDAAGAAEYSSTTEALQAALAMSPELRRLIIAQPDLVRDYVEKSPKLSKLFEGINIRALSLALRDQEERRGANDAREGPPRGPEHAVAENAPSPVAGGRPGDRLAKGAAQMGEQELFAFIDGNEGLRTWMLEHPEELAQRLDENPRLAAFFAGVDIIGLAKRYRAWQQVKGDGDRHGEGRDNRDDGKGDAP